MINLIKNEWKLRRISILRFGIAVAIINIIAIFVIVIGKINIPELLRLSMIDDHEATASLLSSYGIGFAIMLPLALMTNGILLTLPIINAIFTFRRDIFSNQRYLLFSLPVKGSKLIGSRLIVTCLEMALSMLFLMVSMASLAFALFGWPIFRIGAGYLLSISPLLVLQFVICLFEFSLMMLIIYTVLILINMAAKFTTKLKKVLGLVVGILLFSFLNNIWEGMTDGLKKYATNVPLHTDFSALRQYLPGVSLQIASNNITYYFAVVGAEIVFFSFMFIILSYIMDKRIEV